MGLILSIPGVVRTILIIIAVMVILRFIGKVMIARREMEAQKAHDRKQKAFEKAKKESVKNVGRVSIGKSSGSSDIEDVDFEEVK